MGGNGGVVLLCKPVLERWAEAGLQAGCSVPVTLAYHSCSLTPPTQPTNQCLTATWQVHVEVAPAPLLPLGPESLLPESMTAPELVRSALTCRACCVVHHLLQLVWRLLGWLRVGATGAEQHAAHTQCSLLLLLRACSGMCRHVVSVDEGC